jgi:hypothetical protein
MYYYPLWRVFKSVQRALPLLLNLIYIIPIYRLRGGDVLISIEKVQFVAHFNTCDMQSPSTHSTHN